MDSLDVSIGRLRTVNAHPGDRPGPLRLAYVSHCLNPHDLTASRVGGAERVAAELLVALKDQPGVIVTPVIARAASNRLRFLTYSAGAVATLRRLARAGAIDAVLHTGLPTAWMSVLLAGEFRRRHVVSGAIAHGHDVIMDFAPYQGLVRRMFADLDAVMAVSQATGAACLQRGLDPRRMHVTPNSVDAARFAPAPPMEDRRAILRAAFPAEAAALAADGQVICCVGRQVPRKGHAWFVREVVPMLPEAVQFWLAGDGAQAGAIDAAAREAGVTDRVHRLGKLSEPRLAALYRGADLFVMPNVPIAGDMEGFGLVMLEANANGLPVVASRLEGVEEVVTGGLNGVLARAGDAGDFAGRILQLLTTPALRARLGRQAEAYARNGVGWAGVARAQVGILRAAGRARAQLLSESAMTPQKPMTTLEDFMSHVITVAPRDGGWTMRSGAAEPVYFASGAEAEWCARKLGEAMAEAGAAADVHIMLRDGGLAGRFLFQPAGGGRDAGVPDRPAARQYA